MEKLTEVLAAPDVAAYVWLSFLAAGLVMAALAAASLRAFRRAAKTLARLEHEA